MEASNIFEVLFANKCNLYAYNKTKITHFSMINRYNILQHCKTVNHLKGKALKVINSFAMLQEGEVMSNQEVKYHINCQSKHGLSVSSVKTRKFLPWLTGAKNMHFLGPKVKNAIYDGTPSTCTPNLSYISAGKCRGSKSSNGINPLTALPFSFQFCVSTLDIYMCSMQGRLSTH